MFEIWWLFCGCLKGQVKLGQVLVKSGHMSSQDRLSQVGTGKVRSVHSVLRASQEWSIQDFWTSHVKVKSRQVKSSRERSKPRFSRASQDSSIQEWSSQH